MTNDQIIEEILHEAEKLGVRLDVLNDSFILRQLYPSMSLVDSIESAFKKIKQNLLTPTEHD